LSRIQPEESLLKNGLLLLHPPPVGPRTLYPKRSTLIADLQLLEDEWRSVAPRIEDRLFFLSVLCRELSFENPTWTAWLRTWIRERNHAHKSRIRYRYEQHYTQSSPDRELELNALWVPDPKLQPSVLHQALTAFPSATSRHLHNSRRAAVRSGELMGHDIVVKVFAPNPRPWRRRWEISRARRAWVGACILQELGIPCTLPMGWLERRENGRLLESYFISRPVPATENARTWLRRILPGLSPAERIELRHRLRREMQQLHHHGISHGDVKLSNLMVQERPYRTPVFHWMDLEDIRADGPSVFSFIRNLYQLNGSLPRDIRREERIAFANGFQSAFPIASRPWLHRYVERKTRKRLKRELRRVCGA
jgi:hypothetical protein